MKNVLIVDGAENCVFDIFEFTEEIFELIFPAGTDIAFIEEVERRIGANALESSLTSAWNRRVPKAHVHGIHGTLFYQLEFKKVYYPTRRDEEAVNPNGSPLR